MKTQDLKKLRKTNFLLLMLVTAVSVSCSSKETQALKFKEDFDENNIKASDVTNANLINQSEFSQMIKVKDFLEQQAKL